MPDIKDPDLLQFDTADDSEAVAESLSALAAALERDRRATGRDKAVSARRPPNRSSLAGG